MRTDELLNLLLGAGAAGTFAALYKGIKDWREGSWTRKDRAVADLEKWRNDADDAREWAELQHQWWRYWAGRLEYIILTQLGADKLPKREPYPDHPGKEPLKKKEDE